jgi:hypothetical protein
MNQSNDRPFISKFQTTKVKTIYEQNYTKEKVEAGKVETFIALLSLTNAGWTLFFK